MNLSKSYSSILMLLLVTLVFQGCRETEKKPENDTTAKAQIDMPADNKGSNEILVSDVELWTPESKKNISDALQKDLFLNILVEIVPIDQTDEFDKYIQEFKKRYGTPDFKGTSDSFPLSIKEMYQDMLTNLNLRSSQYNSSSFSAIRFYPAISDDGKGNKIMYLVFMGEAVQNSEFGVIRHTIANQAFYQVSQKNGEIKLMDDVEKNQAIKWDIQRFKRDYTPKLTVRSLYFTISKFYTALKRIDPKWRTDPRRALNWCDDTARTSNLKYGLTLYPAIRRDTLLFVVKSHIGIPTASTSRPIQKGMHYLNHIDPCPDKCPEDEL